MSSTTISLVGHFQDFLNSKDTFRVYRNDNLVFASQKDRVLPLLEYLEEPATRQGPGIFFDRITGNAAALLSVKAGAIEIYSPLGSQLGIETLNKHHIKYHFDRVVPFIQKPDSQDMCFMENLSVGKTPEEFYRVIKTIIK